MALYTNNSMISKWRMCRASKIKDEFPYTSPVRNVILLLGRFRTFTNPLAAIDTGEWEWPQRLGENAVVHMMSGKAVQCTFRGHILVIPCLTKQIISVAAESQKGSRNGCNPSPS